MEGNRASTTAQRVALLRAAHQLLDEPKVFDDPVALRIIGRESASALQVDPRRAEPTPLSSALRAYLAVRSRYAEDQLALSVDRGARQYVVLGAGLDTFAYRNPHPKDLLRVFEVDHPATQEWKRMRLGEADIPVPPSLTFAPVDFERQTLEEGLAQAGFAADRCSFFSLLGVTPYLAKDAATATLGYIASMPAGSGVAFDYAVSPSLLDPADRAGRDTLARRAASYGEPWKTFYEPAMLEEELRAAGFRQVEDIGGGEINLRYFRGRTDGLRVTDRAHLVCARI